MAVLEDLQDIAPAVVVQGDEAPVVDKQEVHPGQAGQDFAVTAVAPGDVELLKEPGQPHVERSITLPAGLVAQGAGEIALAHACRPGDEDVLPLLDPATRGELQQKPLVEAAGLAVVDVLDTGRKPKSGHLQPDPEPYVAPLRHLPVDEQPEALLEAKLPEVGHPHLLFPAPGHTPEPQTIELLQSRMG